MEPNKSKRQIFLLVDDDSALRVVMRLYLENYFGDQVQIVEAEDGAQALQCLHERKIDLVVTDGKMPNLEGLELLMEIRDRRLNVLVVMFTGEGREYQERALALGARAVVEKPDFERLLASVERALR